MDENVDGFLRRLGEQAEARNEAMERVLAAADSAKVFGEPVISIDRTVIAASEVAAGGGFGSGMGFGAMAETPGGGGGGGGGGGSMGRPVAVISITSDGVEVKPIIDSTKIILTGLAVVGGLIAVICKVCRRH